MGPFLKTIFFIVTAAVLFAALIYTREHFTGRSGRPSSSQTKADIGSLLTRIRHDSLYEVKEALCRDSGILISVSNPDKTGTDIYFNRKYELNHYDNINMVYIYQYDSTRSVDHQRPEDALMATGKRLGRFQQEWESRFIDSADRSCIPLRKWIMSQQNRPGGFKNEETLYQPASIHAMQVVCKYRILTDSGASPLQTITAEIDSAGQVIQAK